MELKLYFSRILHDKVKMAIAIFLFSLPILEVGQIIWGMVVVGTPMPDPNFATFLSLFTLRHYLQRLLYWFLPLFLLPIVTEDTIEDYDKGYSNVLISRMGAKPYMKTKLAGSFLFIFLLMLLALVINMALVYFCFREGTYQINEWEDDYFMNRDISRLTVQNPLISNIVYIVIFSFVAGLTAMMGTAISLIIHNRKIVYGLTFLLWYVPINLKLSLLNALQPFLYLNYEHVLPILFTVIAGYMMIIMIAAWMEAKDDQI